MAAAISLPLAGLISVNTASATPNDQFVAGAGPAVQVDTSSTGDPSNGQENDSRLSSDGHLVSFTTYATNLFPGDTNNAPDVVVKNMTTGQVMLASAAADGTQANDYNQNVAMTPDGKYVMFNSNATNLVPGITDNHQHMFVKNMLDGSIEVVDIMPSGDLMRGTQYAAITSDGRYIAFVGTNNQYATEVYLRDRRTETTQLVSEQLDGSDARSPSGSGIAITDDGRYVTFGAFQSDYNSTNLNFFTSDSPYYSVGNSGNTGGRTAIYQRDMQGLSYKVMNLDASGAVTAEPGKWQLTPDGRYFLFNPSEAYYTQNIWRRDTSTGNLIQVNLNSQQNRIDGTFGNYGVSMSNDGNRVLIDIPNSNAQGVARDIATQTTYDVSYEINNGRPYSFNYGISGDGSHLLVSPLTDQKIYERTLPPSDSTPPAVTGTPDRASNPAGWYNGPVTVTWTSADPAPSSGIPTTPAASIISTEGTNLSVTSGTSCDPANNCATGTYGGINLDSTPPTVMANVSGSQNAQGSYIGTVTVHYTCTDALSGVASCPVDVALTQPGANQVVARTATDVAGNVNTATVSGISIATPAPSLVVTTPQNGKLHKGTPVTGTVQTQAQITSVQATYTPNGNHAPETITGTVITGQTTNGVTTYTYTIPTPTDVNGRMTVAITVTDSYGQSVTSAPVSVVVN